jgi:hypothetical protein
MKSIKKFVVAAIALTALAILPASAFAKMGHAGHHSKFRVYRGTVATATCASPLAITLKSGSGMSFTLTAKTRYFLNHQRLTSEPCLTVGERVRVKAHERNGAFVALAVRAIQKSA